MQVVFEKTIPEFIKKPVLCICLWNGALGACLSLGKGHFLRQKPALCPHITYVKMLGRKGTPIENHCYASFCTSGILIKGIAIIGVNYFN